MEEVKSDLDKLKQYAGNPSTGPARLELVKKLKKSLTNFTTLPPSTEKPDPKECIIAREVYELACEINMQSGDLETFKRDI